MFSWGLWNVWAGIMARRRRQRRFNAQEYWASRPYCAVCHERKTRYGSVCHKCRNSGFTNSSSPKQTPPSAPAPQPVKTPTTAQAKESPSQPQTDSDNAWWFFVVVCVIAGFLFLGSGTSSKSHSPRYNTISPPPPPVSNGDVRVRGYYRRDGTYVRPHYRTRADGTQRDNYSTHPNVNPYTGKRGSKRPRW